jgi:hypothetical protein
MSISGAPEPPFYKTLAAFCNELKLTFPELTPQVDRAASQTPQVFWRSWKSYINILATRDFDMLTADRRGIIMGAVVITPALWEEVSPATHDAIWRYLRTMLFESAMESGIESMSSDVIAQLLAIFKEERMEQAAEAMSEECKEGEETKFMEHAAEHLLPFLNKLKGLVGEDAGADLSGFTLPEIPEHLRNGHIARMAEDLAKHFKPEEFGIDPALLTGDSVEVILQRLVELYQRDPTIFIAGIKRFTEKIKRQVMGGSINRDQLIAEAKEYVELFKSHPTFKAAIERVQEMFGGGGLSELFGGGGSSSGAPSERLRAVQERLRRKMAARSAGGKTSAQGK